MIPSKKDFKDNRRSYIRHVISESQLALHWWVNFKNKKDAKIAVECLREAGYSPVIKRDISFFSRQITYRVKFWKNYKTFLKEKKTQINNIDSGLISILLPCTFYSLVCENVSVRVCKYVNQYTQRKNIAFAHYRESCVAVEMLKEKGWSPKRRYGILWFGKCPYTLAWRIRIK